VLYLTYGQPGSAPVSSSADERFVPINVDNPALRTDLLQHFLELEYKGEHRNIFSAALPPPPPPPKVEKPVVVENVAPPQPVTPPGPPPLVLNFKYFGFVSDHFDAHRQAMFSTNNDEDVVIAGEGDTLIGKFRVLKISNTNADVEEISSGRRASLALEQPRPTA
jgi:hypothetical protein